MSFEIQTLAGPAGLLLAATIGVGLLVRRRRGREQGTGPAGEGLRLGPYTLVEKLGEGGMGTVYRAHHTELGRPMAVKLLAPSRIDTGSLARFEREFRLTSRLRHPNTVRVFDYGRTAGGLPYYAMEYLSGASLDQVVAEDGPLPAGRVIRILEQIAGALAEAHELGLVHRDVKPANIVLTDGAGHPEVAKLLDFGLVKQVGGASGGGDALAPALTGAHSLAGTPLYMAPETITGPDEVDARADLYALGAVGYFLLTGQHVFAGRNLIEVCGHHLHSRPVPPSRRLGQPVPAALEALLLSCLEKDPAARPASAGALTTALRACREAGSWADEGGALHALDRYVCLQAQAA